MSAFCVANTTTVDDYAESLQKPVVVCKWGTCSSATFTQWYERVPAPCRGRVLHGSLVEPLLVCTEHGG